MKHVLEFIQSGSWKEKVTIEDGEYEHSPPYDVSTEMTTDVECSCGKRFLNAEDAWDHIEEVMEEQQD